MIWGYPAMRGIIRILLLFIRCSLGNEHDSRHALSTLGDVVYDTALQYQAVAQEEI